MNPQFHDRIVRLFAWLALVLVVVLVGPTSAQAMVPAACTPGSCDDNNICTTDCAIPCRGASTRRSTATMEASAPSIRAHRPRGPARHALHRA
jgi:hypothetical protein